VRCNCFGPYFSQRINARTVMRNLVFLGLCVSTLLFFDGAFALDSMIGISSTVHHYSLPLVILPIGVFVLELLVVLTAKRLFMTPTHEA
jgi:predicted tellurium resistance membrane protein TerC